MYLSVLQILLAYMGIWDWGVIRREEQQERFFRVERHAVFCTFLPNLVREKTDKIGTNALRLKFSCSFFFHGRCLNYTDPRRQVVVARRWAQQLNNNETQNLRRRPDLGDEDDGIFLA